ncbi:SgrR family transcriptional regulator [Photobacterium sp. CCB-ST2H9]|uniref:SgrR family transcriptional regulator n=1 Tax=Photobacterium sp. CCB-ST2H9 TaxID=2912855 RepID=UPI0020065C10|nr:SgrR family transcriptional regulator [Photobacterium sp. CCB-ST2H9]UTM56288.1 SgrR family transcriptional regulator [Photobacterium sp. CCB-ST2H9]
MRYWRLLALLRDELDVGQTWVVSLDTVAEKLACTRRNAQMLIKRLVSEGWIQWFPGVGRGNLPTLMLLKPTDAVVTQQAVALLERNQVEQALTLMPAHAREGFLADYLAGFRSAKRADTRDVLRIPFYRGIHDLDVVQLSRRTELHLGSYLYAGLLSKNEQTGDIQGNLAIHWEQQGNDWLFTLRKGLMFHDGTPLTSQSVREHFERLSTSDSCNRQLFDCIAGVEVLTPLRFRMIAKMTPGFIPTLLTQKAAGIAKQAGDGRIIGSGAFMLDEQTEWLTRLVAFDHYHGCRPWLDAVEIWNIGDQAMDFDMNSDVVHPWLVPGRTQQFSRLENWEKGCEYALLNENRTRWMAVAKHRRRLAAFIRQLPLPDCLQPDNYRYAEGMLQAELHPAGLSEIVDLKSLPQPERPLNVVTYQLTEHIALAEQLTHALNNAGIPASCCIETFPDFNRMARLSQADIMISGEVFGEDPELDWMEWLKANTALSACLSADTQSQLMRKIETVFSHSCREERVAQFEAIERWLVALGMYQPLWQNRQQLNVRSHLNGVSLLANGWIDFSRVVFS